MEEEEEEDEQEHGKEKHKQKRRRRWRMSRRRRKRRKRNSSMRNRDGEEGGGQEGNVCHVHVSQVCREGLENRGRCFMGVYGKGPFARKKKH